MTGTNKFLLDEDSSVESFHISAEKTQEEYDNHKDKFNSSTHKVSYSQKLDITILEGIGPSIAKKLIDAGYNSIESLLDVSFNNLAKIKGIGNNTAQKIINSIKSYKNRNTLNNYSNFEPQINSNSENDDSIDEYEIDTEIRKEFEGTNKKDFKRLKSWFSKTYKDSYNLSNQDKIILETDFDEQNNLNDEIIADNNVEPHNLVPNAHEAMVFQDDISGDYKQETNQSWGSKNEPIENIEQELRISNEIILETIKYICLELHSLGYHVISNKLRSSEVYSRLDILVTKEIRVHDTLNLLIILPICINPYKGTLTVSKDNIDYKPNNPSLKNTKPMVKKLIYSLFSDLEHINHTIFNDLRNEGTILHQLNECLKINLSVITTFTRKKLFFQYGEQQYKFCINPVLICQDDVIFLEKVIPFTYHKSSNIHVIRSSQLVNLVKYLEKRYILIEKHSQDKNTLKIYSDAKRKFLTQMRSFSIPIFCFGICATFIYFLLIILSKDLFLLAFIRNLGIPTIIVYTLTIAAIYLNLFKKESIIQKEFKLPEYQRKINLDETSLIIIDDTLSPELMVQFSYECLDGANESKTISKAEERHVKKILTENKIKDVLDKRSLFESKSIPISKSEGFSKKYSSFLED